MEKNYIKLKKSKSLFEGPEYINLGDSGFIELWDFSNANSSHEARVQAISAVASVCYGSNSLNPKFKLYDKLARESIGLPSSSFEFVPVLLDIRQYTLINKMWDSGNIKDLPNVLRFGQFIINDKYLLTNLRALLYDLEKLKNTDSLKNDFAYHLIDPEKDYWYNTKEEEIKIIKENFFVFKIKATIRDFRQHVRHRRAMYQELSRRYTAGNKVPIEFRVSPKLEEKNPGTLSFLKGSVELYNKLLESGLQSQDARDVIPVSMYSTIWTAYYPDGLDNYLKLRTKSSAQKEIRLIAKAMEEMIEK